MIYRLSIGDGCIIYYGNSFLIFYTGIIAVLQYFVFFINGIYTKPTKFRHRQPYGLSNIRPIMSIAGLHIVCVNTTHCTKYILFPIKIAISGH